MASLNWEQTFAYTDGVVSAESPMVQVVFTNNGGFSCLHGVAISHVSPNSCFASPWGGRSREQWEAFRGHINMNWKDLALDLERLIEDRLLISPGTFSNFVPSPDREPPNVGSNAIKRLVIEWRKRPPHISSFVPVDDMKLGFNAEFDLESGKLIWIFFYDPTFLSALARAQHPKTDVR